MRIVALLALVVLYTGCSQQNDRLHLKVNLDLGEDHGQNLGTLFQTVEGHNVYCGAGFQTTYQTYVSSNNRVLTFFVGSDNDLAYEDIGNPFPGTYNQTFCVNIDDELYAFKHNHSTKLKRFDEQSQTWIEDITMREKLGVDIENVQVVDNKLLTFHTRVIRYDGDTIFRAGPNIDEIICHYADGEFLIFGYGAPEIGNVFMLGDWSPTSGREVSIAKEFTDPCPMPRSGKPYCIAKHDSRFVVGTNYGSVYSIDRKSLQIVMTREPEDPSWQPYVTLPHDDKVLIGQYPAGSIFEYEGDSVTPFEPVLTTPAWAPDQSREAQSMVVYGGDLIVGMWPWGELYRLKEGADSWELGPRLFKSPVLNHNVKISTRNDAPYVNFLRKNMGGYNNHWGQRVSGFAEVKGELYAVTSNKGREVDPAEVALLGKDLIEEYGHIYRIKGACQISAQIEWKPQTDLEFIVTEEGEMSIVQDSVVIASKKVDPRHFGITQDDVQAGTGVYGSCVVDLEVTVQQASSS